MSDLERDLESEFLRGLMARDAKIWAGRVRGVYEDDPQEDEPAVGDRRERAKRASQ
jgi:hypothetical protein